MPSLYYKNISATHGKLQTWEWSMAVVYCNCSLKNFPLYFQVRPLHQAELKAVSTELFWRISISRGVTRRFLFDLPLFVSLIRRWKSWDCLPWMKECFCIFDLPQSLRIFLNQIFRNLHPLSNTCSLFLSLSLKHTLSISYTPSHSFTHTHAILANTWNYNPWTSIADWSTKWVRTIQENQVKTMHLEYWKHFQRKVKTS